MKRRWELPQSRLRSRLREFPSREKETRKNPQIFPSCKEKHISAENIQSEGKGRSRKMHLPSVALCVDTQSEAEDIQNDLPGVPVLVVLVHGDVVVQDVHAL